MVRVSRRVRKVADITADPWRPKSGNADGRQRSSRPLRTANRFHSATDGEHTRPEGQTRPGSPTQQQAVLPTHCNTPPPERRQSYLRAGFLVATEPVAAFAMALMRKATTSTRRRQYRSIRQQQPTQVAKLKAPKRPAGPLRLPHNGFTYYLTLSSKFFSTFPHGTCLLSVSR